MKHPFGWHYPAGCTDKDIDERFGSPPTKPCPECGNRGTTLICDIPTMCDRCDGTGEVEIDGSESAELKELEADRWMDERSDRE